jgi:hypothetical protein
LGCTTRVILCLHPGHQQTMGKLNITKLWVTSWWSSINSR